MEEGEGGGRKAKKCKGRKEGGGRKEGRTDGRTDERTKGRKEGGEKDERTVVRRKEE